jgi:hypothetical protein
MVQEQYPLGDMRNRYKRQIESELMQMPKYTKLTHVGWLHCANFLFAGISVLCDCGFSPRTPWVA